MANASTKRIAAANEKALHNLQLGLLGVNVSSPPVPRLTSQSPVSSSLTLPGSHLDPPVLALIDHRPFIPPFRFSLGALHPIDDRFGLGLEMVRGYR